MSDSNNKQKTAEFPEVSGLGSVRVDGKEADVIGTTFKADVDYTGADRTHGSAQQKAKGTPDSIHDAVQEVVDVAVGSTKAATEAHFPKVSSWSHVNKWGIWVGVILVTLGTLIFLDMLSGVVPALSNVFGGYSFWSFWPLLIIFGGLAMAFSPASDSPNPRRNGNFSPARFTEGLFFMTVGIIFLGNSLGYVAWSFWLAMLSYWPLLLVIAGLAILSHGLKTEWFSVLASLISIVILLAVASSMWIGPAPLIEPFASLAEIGSYRGMDLFNIGTRIGDGFGAPR
ncbi:MAG: DUF5668 domain-containing protein [Coriobacteriia bacterium]|nr:DUF5668 domain-containing protein [Coriobacteriia bacterium]MCL2870729.1 DUF5668 domain-containing protein [Coriobacteriia bacterium]